MNPPECVFVVFKRSKKKKREWVGTRSHTSLDIVNNSLVCRSKGWWSAGMGLSSTKQKDTISTPQTLFADEWVFMPCCSRFAKPIVCWHTRRRKKTWSMRMVTFFQNANTFYVLPKQASTHGVPRMYRHTMENETSKYIYSKGWVLTKIWQNQPHEPPSVEPSSSEVVVTITTAFAKSWGGFWSSSLSI